MTKENGKPKCFDFRESKWGWHTEHWDKGDDKDTEKLWGHGKGIREGDYIIRKGAKTPVFVSEVLSIEYRNDPPDMYFATVKNLGGCMKLQEFTESVNGEIVDSSPSLLKIS